MLNRFQTRLWYLALLAMAGGTVGLLGFRWGDRGLRSQPLPQDPHIQVFFNHNPTQRYQDPYRGHQRPGDNLEQHIIDAIHQAHTSIDVAVQELNLPQIAQALITQAQNGISVRIILENQYSQPWSDLTPDWIRQQDKYSRGKYENLFAFGDINGDDQITPQEASQRDAIVMLRQASIPMVDDTDDGSKGSGLMHHKFMVIDGRQVITGSANFTLSGIHGDWLIPESQGNANALLTIQSPELANAYTDEFNLMWGDGPGGQLNSLFGSPKPARPPKTIPLPNGQITVHFSPHRTNAPDTTNDLIANTLSHAKDSVDLALFVFTDQGIANTLAARAQISTRALIDRSFIYRSHSEALDMLGLALPDHRCHYEKDNRPWTTTTHQVGYPNLAEGDKLHHKFARVDNHTTIVGSHNWSNAANHKNDENLLIIKNTTVAQHFKQEFERFFKKAQVGRTEYLSQKLKEAQENCSH